MELTEYNIILVQNFIQLVFFEVLLPWAKGVKANFRLPIFYDDEVNDKMFPYSNIIKENYNIDFKSF